MMGIYDGLTITNEGFAPNDPKSVEQVKNVLDCFVQCVDKGMPISPEMLKFIRDGVAAYTAGDKTPWKGVRGMAEKGDPRSWASLIFHAHILPNWNAHEGKGLRPPLRVICASVKLIHETNVSKSLSRAEDYLFNELQKESRALGRITAEITAIAKSNDLPNGKVIESNGRFYWITPEQEQQLRDEDISTYNILNSALNQARKLADQGGLDNLIDSIHLIQQAEIDAHYDRYARAEISFSELESAVKEGSITVDEYREATDVAVRKFFFCPRR